MSDVGLTRPLLPNDNSALTPSISVASVGAIGAACVACGPDGRIGNELDACASVRRSGTYVDAEGEPEVSASGPCAIAFGDINAAAALVLLGITNIPRSGSKVDAEGKPDAVGVTMFDASDAATTLVEMECVVGAKSGGAEAVDGFEASNIVAVVDIACGPTSNSVTKLGVEGKFKASTDDVFEDSTALSEVACGPATRSGGAPRAVGKLEPSSDVTFVGSVAASALNELETESPTVAAGSGDVLDVARKFEASMNAVGDPGPATALVELGPTPSSGNEINTA